jgi:uncharacterized protein YjbI with pentapeptide repeats
MPDFTREEIDQVVKTARKLQSANLAGIDLSEADLRWAKYDQYTFWPENFDPEASGARLMSAEDAE